MNFTNEKEGEEEEGPEDGEEGREEEAVGGQHQGQEVLPVGLGFAPHPTKAIPGGPWGTRAWLSGREAFWYHRGMGLSKGARKVLKVLARRGASEVLWALGKGSARFSDLEAVLRLSPRTLAERLRELHLMGFVDRRAYAEVPPRVEYSLTPRGKRVLEFLMELDRVVETLEEVR